MSIFTVLCSAYEVGCNSILVFHSKDEVMRKNRIVLRSIVCPSSAGMSPNARDIIECHEL